MVCHKVSSQKSNVVFARPIVLRRGKVVSNEAGCIKESQLPSPYHEEKQVSVSVQDPEWIWSGELVAVSLQDPKTLSSS